MNLGHPGIRVRLTLWYATALLLILACVSAGVYIFVRANLARTLSEQLDRDVETVATVMAASPVGRGRNGHLPGNVLFMVKENQRIVYHSDAWCRTKYLNNGDIEPIEPGGVWRSPEGQAYRLKVAPLWTGGRDLEVTVAEDASVLDDAHRALVSVLLFSIPCAAFLSIAGGYFLAGRALSPIDAMAAKAREITAESLSERLPVSNPNDELGRMATVFNETLGRLSGSFERLRAFTANISHELRTPLTAMRSVGEVSLQRPLDAHSSREVIGSMLEEVDRLTRLVDCLLGLARAESGGANVIREDVDLACVARSTLELVRVLAEEKRQTLSLDAPQRIPIQGDSSMLRQALTNLLDNAIRYTPEGGSIRLSAALSSNHGAVLEVLDDGPGIPPEDRERIFDRFYRTNGSGHTKPQGAGLGLAIARSAVEAHHGRLEYEPCPGGGSRFRMTLPASSG